MADGAAIAVVVFALRLLCVHGCKLSVIDGRAESKDIDVERSVDDRQMVGRLE